MTRMATIQMTVLTTTTMEELVLKLEMTLEKRLKPTCVIICKETGQLEAKKFFLLI